MLIERRSPHSGRINRLELPITPEQLARWRAGELIQNAMPQLDDDEREFLMTGYTRADWDALFPAREEDE